MQISTYQPEYQQQIIDLILSIQGEEFGSAITQEDQPDLLIFPPFIALTVLVGRGGVGAGAPTAGVLPLHPVLTNVRSAISTEARQFLGSAGG